MDNRVALTDGKLRNLRKLVKENASNKRPSAESNCNSSTNVAVEIVELIISHEPTSTSAGECATYLTELFAQPTLCKWLQDRQLERLVDWLLSIYAAQSANDCIVLAAVTSLLRVYPKYAPRCWECLFDPKHSRIVQNLGVVDGGVGGCDSDQLLINSLQCIDVTLSCLVDTQLSEPQLAICEAVITCLLRLHYECRPALSADSTPYAHFLLHSLLLFNKLALLSAANTQTNAAALLGLAKAYMFYGVRAHALPQKAVAAQQTLYDSAEEVEALEQQNSAPRGGKVAKTRKSRVAKAKARQPEVNAQQRRLNLDESALLPPCLDYKTSDSDTSEQERTDGARAPLQRHLSARIRHAAIVLLGAVARAQNRRVLYAYWHVFFPSNSSSSSITDAVADAATRSRDDLLQVAQRDPTARCRSAALQVTAQLLLCAKGFLSQAEYQIRTQSAAFLPFAQSLGISVLATYESFTAILATEASLPVLTQSLKCLALLVQATPFTRFECPIASRFIEHVRKLTQQRDCTVQVSALLVLELLVAAPELTSEIATAIGLPIACLTAEKESRKAEEAHALLELGSLEDLTDSDDGAATNNEVDVVTQPNVTPTADCTSWLVLRVLQNLNYADVELKVPTTVRIASLQLLAAMATHFTLLLNTQLPRIALSLESALCDPLPDVRLYAARALDACAYQMARALSEQPRSTADRETIELCVQFWTRLLPAAMARIHGAPEEIPVVKSCLCDALSNIGVVIYERLLHGAQMNLLSFLSGISSDPLEDMTVRAAAGRALAVYVLFPSLRDNLVFIENTAELTLRLVDNANLVVRVKALWSLGNVSDALLCSNTDSGTHERISDALLQRLIEASAVACSDNDKVRCNAVRTLGNLLRLLTAQHFSEVVYRNLFQKSVGKLIDCLRVAGNAKVKWNTCYAIGNLLRNEELFAATTQYADLNWQTALYPALCHVIVQHGNFKVRINATAAMLHIGARAHYGAHFERFWCALLEAVERSSNLQNFYEYNHRDQLQEQLCLGMCHLLGWAIPEDFPVLKRRLVERLETVQTTWTRVTNRMLPEKSAPLQACPVLLRELLRTNAQLSADQRSAIVFIAQTLTLEQ